VLTSTVRFSPWTADFDQGDQTVSLLERSAAPGSSRAKDRSHCPSSKILAERHDDDSTIVVP